MMRNISQKKIINNKKLLKVNILLIVLAMFFMCSLTGLNAADQTINNTTSGGINDAISTANDGDTIYLQEGIYKGTNNTGLTINKNLTFIGNGSKDKVIIDAENIRRIFTLNSGINVTFVNITFLNGNGSNNGGAIYNQYTDTILTVKNSKFMSNTAIYGGAIYNNGANMIIINSSFVKNYAGDDAASIYNSGINQTIINSTFINNTAYNRGGGVFNMYGHNQNIINCNFINNTANSGGAVFSRSINQTIINSTFIGNSANNGGGIDSWVDTNQTIINSTFINNTATDRGGAVDNYASTGNKIIGSKFINNTANRGSAIGVFSGGQTNVSYSIFLDNYNYTIYNDNTNLTIADFNYWNSNNITGMYYGNVDVNNYYLADIAINNVSKYGENLIITYKLINNVTGTNEGSDLLPLFSAFIDYNGQIYNIADARNEQNITTTVNEINNTVKLINNNNTLITKTFNVTQANTNITINVSGDKKVGNTITITGTLKDEYGNPINGEKINFYINGKYIGSSLTNENGIATFDYIFNQKGDYTIIVDYEGNEDYYNSSMTLSINIADNPGPTPDPKNNTNYTNKTTNNSSAYAAMKETGIPILAVILVLLSSLGVICRKK